MAGSPGSRDVTIEPDGSLRQKPHGDMDETMVLAETEHQAEGPTVPEHDHFDPVVKPAAPAGKRSPG